MVLLPILIIVRRPGKHGSSRHGMDTIVGKRGIGEIRHLRKAGIIGMPKIQHPLITELRQHRLDREIGLPEMRGGQRIGTILLKGGRDGDMLLLLASREGRKGTYAPPSTRFPECPSH